MHRSNPVPRLFGWSFFVGFLLLHAGLSTASAQEYQPVRLLRVQEGQPKDKSPEVVFLTLSLGTAQPYTMASKLNLKKVENPNSKVVNVSQMQNEPKSVLFDAVGLGRTRIKLTDVKDNVEYVEVVVVSDLVKELRDMLQRAVPNAAVTVTSSDGGRTIVLTGTVKSIEDGKAVQQIAGQMFGVNVINQVIIGGVQQVQLEVLVASVNRSLMRQMSFSFSQASNSYYVNSIFGGPFTLANAVASSGSATAATLSQSGSANIPFGILGSNASFFAFLQALRTENLTKIMAEPRVLTMSGKKAVIVSGGQTPVLTASGVGAPSVSYKDFGTVVAFLPIVLGNGKINLAVHAEVSNIDPAFGINITGVTPTAVPGFATQVADVEVQMEDGQTFAIGGLVENDVTASISRIPWLGELPFLGVLFSQKSYQETEKELIILVTPRLVDPVDCTKIPKYLPGRESRTPDDFEFFLEGILEAPRGQRNLALHPHGYQAAYHNAPNSSQLPCNNSTGCANGNCANGNCATGGCANGSCGVPTSTVPGAPTSTGSTYMQRPTPAVMPPISSMTVPVNSPLPTVVTPGPAPLPSSMPTTIPMSPSGPPARELETRPVLPPVSFGPAN